MPGWVTKVPQATRHGPKKKKDPTRVDTPTSRWRDLGAKGCAEVCQSGQSHSL